MNVEELVGLTGWIDAQIKGRRIPPLYSALSNLLQNASNGAHEPFSDQKDALIAELRSVDLSALTNEQRSFLEKLNVLIHLGQEGVTELEDILFKNSLDIKTAANRVAQISSMIQQAVERSDSIKSSLKGLIDSSDETNDEILVRVAFLGAASIDNIVDFKKWATEWHDIGRGIAMAVGATPKDIRVVGAQKGSIIVLLATTYGIAQVITTILLKSLEVADKVLSLRQKLLEIESLKLSNDKLSRELKTTIEEERTLGLGSISKDARALVGGAPDGEQVSALEKSIKKLLAFIESGGTVDVVLPLEESSSNENEQMADTTGQMKKLREDVHKVRELEDRLKLLGHSDPNEDT